MYAAIQLLGYGWTPGALVAPAIAIAVPASAPSAAASAATLPSATPAAPTALLGPIAALAVNRTVASGLEGDCGRLTTTGANHGGAGAHAAPPAAITAIVLGMGRSMAAAPGRALLGLAARLAAARRGVAAFLEKLLFSSSENKFLSAVATG